MGKPVRIWIDGIEYPSLLAAKMELGAMKTPASRKFHACLLSGAPYRGHTVSLAPPIRPVAKTAPRAKGTLLRHPCTHRIGAYMGQAA